MDPLSILFVAGGAFLLGSVPTGFLVAQARGVDIRTRGSGNIGATNVCRTLGRPLGIFVFAIDALKGFGAVWLTEHYGPHNTWTVIVAAVAVVAGYNYTPWLGFKGGKGIATSAGALLALTPWAVLAILVVWIALFKMSRYVSLASIGAAAALPVAVGLLWYAGCGGNALLLGFSLVISALAIWRHRTNIQRLRDGTESRFERKKK